MKTTGQTITFSLTLLMLSGLLFTALALANAVQAADKPNILLIVTDNTGWGDWGAYGGGALRGAPSPRIDQLAAEGMRLQNFNTEAQCTPSRAALMTGRLAVRTGNQSVSLGSGLYGLVPWEVTIAEAMSEAGYATSAFGKWHLGKTAGRWPTDQGFDEWYGIPNSTGESVAMTPDILAPNSVLKDVLDATADDATKPWIMESRKGKDPKRLKLYDLEQRRLIDGEVTSRTIDFMNRSKKADKPFFAYVPLTATHYPTLPHPDFVGKSGHGDYADMLVQTDHYVGEMLDALTKLGIEKNTIVIFTADNGIEHPDNGNGQFAGWTGPWAGTYFTAMEGGLRTPFIMRWPGKVPAGQVNNEIVHLVDVFPTLAKMAGVKVPTDRAIDGVDMADFFLGKRAESGREGFVIFVGNDLRAMKWRNWKWHFAWQETKYDPVQRFSTVPKIVDLTRDPREERQAAQPYNNWAQFPFMKLMLAYKASLEKHPNVPVGALDTYSPKY